jgi:hypothetical protein
MGRIGNFLMSKLLPGADTHCARRLADTAPPYPACRMCHNDKHIEHLEGSRDHGWTPGVTCFKIPIRFSQEFNSTMR